MEKPAQVYDWKAIAKVRTLRNHDRDTEYYIKLENKS